MSASARQRPPVGKTWDKGERREGQAGTGTPGGEWGNRLVSVSRCACFFNQIMMMIFVCVCLFWGCMYFLYTFWILTPYQIDGLQILLPTPKFQLCKMNMF